jgi:hypothetical protein
MRTHPPWLNRAGRSLAGRLEHLGDTLDSLRDRLRESVAGVIGQTVAVAVRDVLRTLLRAPVDMAPPPTSSRSTNPPFDPWYEPDDLYREDRTTTLLDHSDGYDAYDDELPEHAAVSEEPASRSARWGLALAMGCEAVAWWLRRQAGRCSPLGAFGIGLCCSAAAYLAGASLADSVLSLVHIADLVRSSTGVLATLSTS